MSLSAQAFAHAAAVTQAEAQAEAASAARHYGIFRQPVAGEQITELLIRDPYGCADDRNRQALVDFVAMLSSAARSIVKVGISS